MKVDVIIPVLDLEKYIRESINSVLEQKFIHKIYIIDAGCSDNSISIVKQIESNKVNIIQNNGKLNASKARNVGVKLSNAKFISFLDGDDFWLNNKIEMQLSYLEANFNNICFSEVEQFYSEELNEEERKKIKVDTEPSSSPHVGTMLCSRETFNLVGLFDESLKYGEFIDWFIRAKNKKIDYKVLNKTFMKRRIHQTNTGRVRKNDRIDLVKILKKSIIDKKIKK